MKGEGEAGEGPASPICTGLLAGTLHAAAAQAGGPAHPWLSQATELLWSRIDALSDVGPYDMRALFWFLDNVPDRDRARAAMEKIGPMIFDGGMVALDPETPGEVHYPLDFAPLPGSLARSLFDPYRPICTNARTRSKMARRAMTSVLEYSTRRRRSFLCA